MFVLINNVLLGNRTPKQVCSRVQKYFIKLHKAGLPVPGRIPKLQPGEKMQKVCCYSLFILINIATNSVKGVKFRLKLIFCY